MPALTATTRTPAYKLPTGGGSNLQFYFPDTATHQSYLDYVGDAVTTAAVGWIELFDDLSGGSLAYNRETNTVRNEAGEKVAETSAANEIVVARGIMGTDAEAILAAEWLEDNPLKARDILPVTPSGTNDTSGGSTEIAQLWGYYEVSVRKTNRTIPLADGTARTMDTEFVAAKVSGQTRIFEVAEVDILDDASWPAKMSPFLNTPA